MPNTNKDSDILQACREFKQNAQAGWSEIYNTAQKDIEFVTLAGKQWDERDKQARDDAKRPYLTINKLSAFVRRQVNSLRDAGVGLDVLPVDDSDTDDAEVRQKMLRHILKKSQSDIATEHAYKQAVSGGFGFWRITTEYESDTSFNKKIVIKRIENQFGTYISPESRCPTGSDATEAITGTWLSKAQFKAQYPNEPYPEVDDYSDSWCTSEAVYIAEYYRIEQTPDTLYQMADGQTVLKSKLAELDPSTHDMQVVNERPSTRKQVMWYKCTASKVLSRTQIEGDYIPIVLVSGAEEWINNKRYLFGLVHDAKDSQRLYNYARTAQAEQLKKAGNRPYIAAFEAVEGFENDWESADDPNTKVLFYNHLDDKEQPLAPPVLTQPYQGSPDLIQEAMTANEEIKDITGIHDASLGMQSNETSGRAILARQKQGDLANFHFLDNYKLSYMHMGRIILSMLPAVYDTARIIRITEPDGEVKTMPINQAMTAKTQYKELKDSKPSANELLNDLSVGMYDVQLSTGVDFNTQREEAREVLMELGRSYPQLMEVAGDLLVKAFEFPDAQTIAERIKKTLPPELLEDDEEGQPQIPPQLQQQIEQMQQAYEQLQAEAEKLAKEAQDKTADREKEVYIAQLRADTELEKARIAATNRLDDTQLKQTGDLLKNGIQANQPAIGDEYQQGVYDKAKPPQEGGFLMPEQDTNQSLAPYDDQLGANADMVAMQTPTEAENGVNEYD